jgi:hypothetical protein
MNPDFVDLLRAFIAADVRFLIVGHTRWRCTGGLVRRATWMCESTRPPRTRRVIRALADFGAPLTDVSVDDFSRERVTHQLGVEPGRIDIACRSQLLRTSEPAHCIANPLLVP